MVNRPKKTEGAEKKAAITAPKRRVVTKAKPVARITQDEPAPKPAKTVKVKAAKLPSPSSDDIALRAYFIAEKRQKDGLPGDSLSDWVQAEAELISERRTNVLN
jgi:hypothetical protein